MLPYAGPFQQAKVQIELIVYQQPMAVQIEVGDDYKRMLQRSN